MCCPALDLKKSTYGRNIFPACTRDSKNWKVGIPFSTEALNSPALPLGCMHPDKNVQPIPLNTQQKTEKGSPMEEGFWCGKKWQNARVAHPSFLPATLDSPPLIAILAGRGWQTANSPLSEAFLSIELQHGICKATDYERSKFKAGNEVQIKRWYPDAERRGDSDSVGKSRSATVSWQAAGNWMEWHMHLVTQLSGVTPEKIWACWRVRRLWKDCKDAWAEAYEALQLEDVSPL